MSFQMGNILRYSYYWVNASYYANPKLSVFLIRIMPAGLR